MFSWVDALLWAAVVVLSIPSFVFFFECLVAFLPGGVRAHSPPSGPRPRLAILVPAHDEEAGVGPTVEALARELRDGDRLVVVADNCSDGTAPVARAAGATVIERTNLEERGKGYAIVFGLDYLASDPPDVVISFDADCRIAPGGIDRIARQAHATGRPVQAEYLLVTHQAAKSPKAVVSQLAFLVRNRVRPRGLARLGLPVHLTGSGMAFPWLVLRNAPATGSYLVEDLLMGIELALMGTPPIFFPEAQVTSELPDEDRAAMGQRRRWEHGQLTTLVQQAPRLIGAGLARGKIDLLALGLDLAVPPLAFLVMLLGLAVVGTAAVAGLGLSSWRPFFGAFGAFGAVGLGVVLAWLRFGRASLPLRYVVAIPLYVLWKVPLYLSFLFKRKQATWERTERSRDEGNDEG